MTEWIPVKEKLPKTNDDVIVFTATDEIEIGNYVSSKWITSSYGKVLYWMPLPPLPGTKKRTPQFTANDEPYNFYDSGIDSYPVMDGGFHIENV